MSRTLNVVMPMAGRGERFRNAGYDFPKPFIRVGNAPMHRQAIDSVAPWGIRGVFRGPRTIFIISKQVAPYLIYEMYPHCVISADAVTRGPACTVLLAKSLIDNDNPLLIVNCDLVCKIDWEQWHQHFCSENPDCCVFTFPGQGPQYSYSRVLNGRVVEVAVKDRQISADAHTGVYFFNHGRAFVAAAEALIARDETTNGEFYVDAVVGEMVRTGKMVTAFASSFFASLGTPEDLEKYLKGHP